MATQAEAIAHNPQIVGNAFVEQYYQILHTAPEQVHKFYHESSLLSRPGPDGAMTSVTTMEGINEMILSFDYTNYKVEIRTADAEISHKDGVIVLVTGWLTGKDNFRKQFAQYFFLAPQDNNGYFVLNDIFRYVDGEESVSMATNNVTESVPAAPLTPDTDKVIVEPVVDVPNPDPVVNHTNSPVEESTNNVKEFAQPLENGHLPVAEKVIADHPIVTSQNDDHPIARTTFSALQEDAPKKSYASIVHALKGNTAPFQVRSSPVKPVERPRAATPSEPVASSSINVLEKKNDLPDNSNSIFVANLPMNSTVEQLKEIFEKFGPIKQNGVQVRSFKGEKNCFGFVEFESSIPMQKAIEASPIMIGNRKAPIEKKRGSSDSGKYSPRRGGYRNNFVGRGNSGVGCNYGRNEFEKQGGFSGQVRGPAWRNGETNQKDYQNGGGRVGRQGQYRGQNQGGAKLAAAVSA